MSSSRTRDSGNACALQQLPPAHCCLNPMQPCEACSNRATLCRLRRPFAMKYAEDQDAFFEDYSKAHVKLSELGEPDA